MNTPARPESPLATRTIDFDGHPVTAVPWDGRLWWVASQVGAAIGYAEGRKLVANVRDDWRHDFLDGRDFRVLAGADLRAFQRAANDCTGGGKSSERGARGGARALMVLSESGIDLALVLARTEPGRRLRRILVDVVIPQLRATGAAALPGAPAPVDGPAVVEMVRVMMAEAGATLRAEILAELRAAQPANQLPDALPFLDRRARSLVLAPILTIAKVYAGASGDRRRVMQERGRIDRKLRDALNWQRRWCFYPAHELGRLAALIEVEGATANRVAAELARARQLDLVPRPGLPARGQA